jgi:hypothetical protein
MRATHRHTDTDTDTHTHTHTHTHTLLLYTFLGKSDELHSWVNMLLFFRQSRVKTADGKPITSACIRSGLYTLLNLLAASSLYRFGSAKMTFFSLSGRSGPFSARTGTRVGWDPINPYSRFFISVLSLKTKTDNSKLVVEDPIHSLPCCNTVSDFYFQLQIYLD